MTDRQQRPPGKVFLGLLSILVALAVRPAAAFDIGVAGSPVASISDGDFKGLFSELRRNGISVYFPTFQFQEVPEPRSLGFEKDFTVPCAPDDPAFQALRDTGMKIILPGEFVYPAPERIGDVAISLDPLSQLIACAGRDHIAGITNYDEAAFHGIPIGDVEKFYARVKQIDPSLPVLMVHAPVITDKPSLRGERRIKAYLDEVRAYGAHADIVGFDVYPVPAAVANIATPFSGDKPVGAGTVVADYMSWLNEALPGKRKLMVLQGFAYSDLYEGRYREANVPAALLQIIEPPDADQMSAMFTQARSAGAELILYWGQASLPDTTTPPWPSILALGRRFGQ